MTLQKTFCGGFLCRKIDRIKCSSCGIYVCSMCSAERIENGELKRYCIDCVIDEKNNNILKAVNNFVFNIESKKNNIVSEKNE